MWADQTKFPGPVWQASPTLPVRWGGIGVRSVVHLAPSAYLASAFCTADLTQSLLPVRLQTLNEVNIDPTLSTWSTMASTPSQTATPPIIATKQRNWDEIICRNLADSLLSGTADPVEQARLLASRSEGSGVGWAQYQLHQSV